MERLQQSDNPLDLKEIIDQLTFFFAEIMDLSGEPFFEAIVKQLASILHADTVFVGRLQDVEKSIVQTIAVCSHETIESNFYYSLQNTPSVSLLSSSNCCYVSNVAHSFPEDWAIQKYKANGYIGIPLFDGSKELLGIIVALFKNSIEEPEVITNIMEIFASRTASEIERMMMKAKLEESTTHFYEIYNQSPVAMLEFDFSSLQKSLALNDYVLPTSIKREILPYIVLRDCNATAAKLFAVSQVHPKQHTTRNLSKPIIKVFAEIVKNLLEGDDAGDVIVQYKDIDAKLHDLQIHWNLPRRFEQSWAMLLVVAQDFSTVQDVQKNVFQVEKMQSLSSLASGIAHDFNNQLGGIMAMAEAILYQAPNNAELSPYIHGIIKAVKASTTLTDKLLDFSQQGKNHSQIININEIVEDVINKISHTLGSQISIVTGLASHEVLIKGDYSQIQNAILNLCLNAVDAMPTGGTLTISTNTTWIDYDYLQESQIDVPIGEYVSITVADTGIGIPSKNVSRIFEPFFTTKEIEQAAGMGLSATYGIIKKHAGSIVVSSEVGIGSIFTMYLPNAQKFGDIVQSDTKDSGGRYDGYQVLLVDDEEIIRESVEALLKSFGFLVTTAVNGQKAVEQMRSGDIIFDIILMDMVMPIKNGAQAIAEIRTFDTRTPIIVCSGYTNDENIERILEKGLSAFLRKPFRRDELIVAIDTLLKPR